MSAWAKSFGPDAGVVFLADQVSHGTNSWITSRASTQPCTYHTNSSHRHANEKQDCTFVDAVGLGCELFGSRRLMRFSMLVDDGVVRSVNVEKEANDLSVSSADHMLEKVLCQ